VLHWRITGRYVLLEKYVQKRRDSYRQLAILSRGILESLGRR